MRHLLFAASRGGRGVDAWRQAGRVECEASTTQWKRAHVFPSSLRRVLFSSLAERQLAFINVIEARVAARKAVQCAPIPHLAPRVPCPMQHPSCLTAGAFDSDLVYELLCGMTQRSDDGSSRVEDRGRMTKPQMLQAMQSIGLEPDAKQA